MMASLLSFFYFDQDNGCPLQAQKGLFYDNDDHKTYMLKYS